jgi:hypothetical protein
MARGDKPLSQNRLAGEPPDVQVAPSNRGRTDSASAETQKLRQHVDDYLVGLRADRWSWWAHWQQLADYVLPRRYRWLITPNQMNRGSPMNQRIIDSTPTVAARVLASGMMAGITSPGRPWFQLKVHGDDELSEWGPVRQWLDIVATIMRQVYAGSNFYQTMAVTYKDLSVFCTGTFAMYEDYDDVIRCQNWALGEYYLANGPRGDVDIAYREFVQTIPQVAREFGMENCSQTIQAGVRTAGAQMTKEIILGHAIEPNDDVSPGAPGVKGMPYREVFWEMGSGQNEILRLAGFHEKPFMAARWDVVGNDAYGNGPGMDALGDIKQLQVEQKRKSQLIGKLVNPPMVADPILKNEPASVIEGGVTYAQYGPNGKPVFAPVYEINPQGLPAITSDIEEVQNRVKTVFFYDLFLMISQLDSVRTATEIDARREEKLIQLGPVLERFENEVLDPAINRTFQIMLRAGMLPPIPKELRGKHIQPEYVSMLAQSQRSAMTAGFERLAQFGGNLAAVKPEILDNIDFDEMIDEYADMLGVPAKVIVPYAKVLQLRAQRNKQQQAAQAMQSSLAMAQGAQTLSNTDVGGGINALQAMLGTGGGQPAQGAAS